jgi:hypothetical protein
MWFAASLLFRSSRIPQENKPTIWEESVRLVEASSEQEALKTAERLGVAQAQTYEVEGGIIVWTFERVERVFSVDSDELQSGVEIFSRFLKDSEVQSLLKPFDDVP